jgi:hypothetical protein
LGLLEEVGHDACGLNPDIANFIRLHRPIESVQEMLEGPAVRQVLAREELPARRGPGDWPGNDFQGPMEFGLINERAAISQALKLGFRGAFLCEQ